MASDLSGKISQCPRSWHVRGFREILDEPAAADLNTRLTGIFSDEMDLVRWLLSHNGNIDDEIPGKLLEGHDFVGVQRVLDLEYPQAA